MVMLREVIGVCMKWILCLSLMLMVSCTESGGSGGGSTSYSIKDQTLTGKVNNKSFTFVEGTFEDGFDAGTIKVTLFAVDAVDACSPTGSENDLMVFFTIPEAVGEYPLKLGSESQTITLYDKLDGNLNIIATEGLIEIESLDATTLEGGIAIGETFDSKVNGKFTVTKCP
jgi:hypothetical protein